MEFEGDILLSADCLIGFKQAEKQASASTSSSFLESVPESEEARSSRSRISFPERLHSRRMIRDMAAACPGSSSMTEALVWMTVSGERSSWEAAEIKSVCLCWYSAIGCMARPRISRAARKSAANPARSNSRKKIPRESFRCLISVISCRSIRAFEVLPEGIRRAAAW